MSDRQQPQDIPRPPSQRQPSRQGSASHPRRLSETWANRGPGSLGVLTTPTGAPGSAPWPIPVSPNSEAGGRAPSVSSALVDMEQEQEAQVNRLLGAIQWYRSYITDLQRKLAESGQADSSTSVSVALEDVLQRAGRSPYPSGRNVSSSRPSSVSSFRGGPGQSPSLVPQLPPSVISGEPLSASHGSNLSSVECMQLRRENDVLKTRIRDLERQLRNAQATVRESMSRASSVRATVRPGPGTGTGTEETSEST